MQTTFHKTLEACSKAIIVFFLLCHQNFCKLNHIHTRVENMGIAMAPLLHVFVILDFFTKKSTVLFSIVYFFFELSIKWVKLKRSDILVLISIIVQVFYILLEIKPCGLGSRIRDMEAEWRLKVITDLFSWWIFGKENWHCWMNRMLS